MANAIFIVGYYRSGTSALSSALQRLGVKFYNEAVPNEHNPLGFYEIPELIEFDSSLFAQLGVEWHDVRNLPDNWVERSDIKPFASQLESVLRRRFLPEDTLWGLKHPHLCRTLPLYERATRRAGHTPHVVHVFRDPWVSAASQCRKNGLSRAHALLLWLSYTTNAEYVARHLPRTWLTYNDLLADPALHLSGLAPSLGLNFQDSEGGALAHASAVFDGQFNRAEPLTKTHLCQPLEDLVERVWGAIEARRFGAALWDGFAAETADLVGFLTEIGASRANALPSFGGMKAPAANMPATVKLLRPTERTDDCAKQGLVQMRDAMDKRPSVTVLVAAPAGRAHVVAETLDSLRSQWEAPAVIKVLTVDTLILDDVPTLTVSAEPEALTKALCAELNLCAAMSDYVAVLNAGDSLSVDACLRLALLAAQTGADMLYSDEIVSNDGNSWVRYKPNWDVTRLRQSAYIGDWVWYSGKAVLEAGGFNSALAGAEEYDMQLRFAARAANVVRLPEAVFTRHAQSRRDDILPQIFCARAQETLSAHLDEIGISAQVQNRQHPGLFHHVREVVDPGTSIIMLCDGADILSLDKWLTVLLTGLPLSGPIILVGAELSSDMRSYLTKVSAQREALEGKVLAVIGATIAEALDGALALATTELLAFLDARMQEVTPYWQEQLRARLVDSSVVAVGARTLTPIGQDARQSQVMGPIILGANTRLGGGQSPLDPGPGGWLLVDQEASAITPPGFLVRREAFSKCQISRSLTGDALWIDLCAQLRMTDDKLVWTPDVSFVMPDDAIMIDVECRFRTGSPAAQALPWADPYHHPALSLHDNLLVVENRTGLVAATPISALSLLLTGDNQFAGAALSAARTLRLYRGLDVDWAPGLPGEADLRRRAAKAWIRLNPTHSADIADMPYTALFTTMSSVREATSQKDVLQEASHIFATSPGLVKHLRKLVPRKTPVELWRPALSGAVWQSFKSASGLNTTPRVLWVDEGFAPAWFYDLITQTREQVSWLVLEKQGATYPEGVTRLPMQTSELGWAELLSVIGPQIMLRPAEADVHADCYPALLAAAAGCRLIIDSRLDMSESLGALRLPNRQQDWLVAVQESIANLADTLKMGAKARAAALDLPTLERVAPGWIPSALLAQPALLCAAE